MLTIRIATDNAAFEDNPGEVSRILRRLATYLDWCEILPGGDFPLVDSNGNTVGEARCEEG